MVLRRIRQAWSRIALMTACLVGAPGGAYAARTVTLAWDPPASTNIVGYHLYYGTASRQYTRALAVGAPWATVTGLIEGKTYYFAVTASNDLGLESTPSDELLFTVPPMPAGTYSGLFYDSKNTEPASSGSFVLAVSRKGAYSGQLRLGVQRYRFSGALDQHYATSNRIVRADGSVLSVQLSLGNADESGVVSGNVTGGVWSAALFGERAVFRGKRYPAPWKGRYTMVFPGVEDDSGAPAGDGFGQVIVTAAGGVHLAGRLADGTKITQSATVSARGQWPFYVPLYSGEGMGISWMAFKRKGSDDVNGTMYWVRTPDAGATFYPEGFSCRCAIAGSIYHPPGRTAPRVFEYTNGIVVFSGGNLGIGFTNEVIVGATGVVEGPGASGFSLKVSPSKGTFTGRAADPLTGVSLRFQGVVLQNRGEGYGYLLGTNESSRVLLAPVPAPMSLAK